MGFGATVHGMPPSRSPAHFSFLSPDRCTHSCVKGLWVPSEGSSQDLYNFNIRGQLSGNRALALSREEGPEVEVWGQQHGAKRCLTGGPGWL